MVVDRVTPPRLVMPPSLLSDGSRLLVDGVRLLCDGLEPRTVFSVRRPERASEEDAVRIAEVALVTAAQNGDEDAFRRLVDRYQPLLVDQMRRFSRDRTVVEDLVHDAFVEAFLSLASFRGKSPFEHWLRKIAVRTGYRHWKRESREKRRRELIRQQSLAAGDLLEPPADAMEAREQMHTMLSRLAPRDRLVLTLLYWDGHSVEEAAKLAGWSQAMVKVQAHRARKRLKALLEQANA